MPRTRPGFRRSPRDQAAALLAIWLGAPALAQAPILPAPTPNDITLTLELVASGLSGPAFEGGPTQFAPTDLAHAGDGSGRLFVATLGGVVRVIDADGNLLPDPFLDTTTGNPAADLTRPGNYGMVCVAFHPGFADPMSPGFRRLYTITTEFSNSGTPTFTAPQSGQTHQDVLNEWQADANNPNAVDTSTRRELIRTRQPRVDHNLNQVAFGPDGLMHITMGDGGNTVASSNHAQQLSNAFGKVLRIDVDMLPGNAPGANNQYAIPADNPFVDEPGALPEIYAYGLRNPYRLSFDDLTGALFVGDVGQRSVEEVNIVTPGGNYGWNLKEGSFLYDPDTNFSGPINSVQPDLPDKNGQTLADREGLTDPVAEYDHLEGRSITGGHVARGTHAALEGLYVFADFFRGRLFAVDADPASRSARPITEFPINPDGAPLPQRIYALGRDEQGGIYILGGPANGSDGVVLRIAAARAPCPGDLNDDDRVDFDDFSLVLAGFGATYDFGDFSLVLAHFGQTCN